MVEHKDGIIGEFPSVDIQAIDLSNYDPNNTIILIRGDTREMTIENLFHWTECIHNIFPAYKVAFVPKELEVDFKEKDYERY